MQGVTRAQEAPASSERTLWVTPWTASTSGPSAETAKSSWSVVVSRVIHVVASVEVMATPPPPTDT